MISVIVPVYKAEKVISRCIESVIAQEYQDWELILVDDGSPDKSGEICDEYAARNERIRAVHKKNEGASQARNYGISRAKGEYISFVDSDDYLSPRYLLDFAQDPLCDFEIQGFTHTYPQSACVVQNPSESGCFSILEMFSLSSLWYLIKGPCCKLFRRRILDENHILFPKEFSYGEDEIFVLDYLAHCSNNAYVHAVSNYFYTHENGESLTHRFVPGLVLQATIAKQFSLFRLLESKDGSFPESFIRFYRKDRAIDFYQSVYNIWIDSTLSLFNRIVQTMSVDSDVWSFINSEDDLPKGFKKLRRILFALFVFK